MTGRVRTRPGSRDEALRHARVCYDHLVGAQGVRLHDALAAQNVVVLEPDGLALSAVGRARLAAEGLDLAALDAARHPLCGSCLN